MTETERQILRKYARPGSEDALIDLVTIMLGRSAAPDPVVIPGVPPDWARPVGPMPVPGDGTGIPHVGDKTWVCSGGTGVQ